MGINWSTHGFGMAYFQTNPNSFDQPIFGWQYPIICSGSHFLEHNIFPLYICRLRALEISGNSANAQQKWYAYVCSPRFFWTCLISLTLDCMWVWLNDLGTDRFAVIRTYRRSKIRRRDLIRSSWEFYRWRVDGSTIWSRATIFFTDSLWYLFHVAMEHGPVILWYSTFIDDLFLKIVIFHSYVSLQKKREIMGSRLAWLAAIYLRLKDDVLSSHLRGFVRAHLG